MNKSRLVCLGALVAAMCGGRALGRSTVLSGTAFDARLLVAGAAAVANAAGSPMVEITKTCPPLRYIGREATYEVTVTNKGTAPALNVVVTDVITGGIEFIRADAGGTREGDKLIWRLGTLDGGQSKTLKSTFRCVRLGTVKNKATVTYCAEASAECETQVKGIPAILLECVDDPDPIEVGANLTYTIVVTNQGSEVGTNINVECTVPPEEEFVNASGATTATASGKSVKFATLPTLAPKAKATFTVTVKGLKTADARFRVSLRSDQTVSPVEETESTHIYE